MKCALNKEISLEMLNQMPENKKEQLEKALDRNNYLTSFRGLPIGEIFIYKEGFLLKLEGTRTNFSVYAKDNDGEFEFCRKPVEKKLHLLYVDSLRFSESDFRKIK